MFRIYYTIPYSPKPCLAPERGHTFYADAAQRGELLDHLARLLACTNLKRSVPLAVQLEDLLEQALQVIEHAGDLGAGIGRLRVIERSVRYSWLTSQMRNWSAAELCC